RLTSARALGKATSKLSTRKNRRRPLPGLASWGLVNEGCPWAPHSWRQSRTVPSESTICPKSSWAGAVSGSPSRDGYKLKLWGTSATPMIVHVRFIGSSAAEQSLGRFLKHTDRSRLRHVKDDNGDKPTAGVGRNRFIAPLSKSNAVHSQRQEWRNKAIA